jgi:hypothetical protein
MFMEAWAPSPVQLSRPENTLLRIDIDPGVYEFNELRWNPTDDVVLDVSHPRIPSGDIVVIEETFGCAPGRAVAQGLPGVEQQQPSAL